MVVSENKTYASKLNQLVKCLFTFSFTDNFGVIELIEWNKMSNQTITCSNESKTTSVLSYAPNIKPSVFCSSLEAFSKYCVYAGKSPGQDLAGFDRAPFVPDHQDPTLANWDKWMKVHKVQQDSLTSKLNRPPQCMLMNSHLNNLYVNQEKNVLSEAANQEHCDKYRGHRNFWITGDNFKNDGSSLGNYQTIERRYDRSHPKLHSNSCPEPIAREYVGVPDKINEEKDLIRDKCLPSSRLKWDGSEYVKKREKELRDKLQMIQPHKPDVSDIIVVGKSVNHLISSTPKPRPNDLSCASIKTETSTCFEPFPTVSSMSVKIDDQRVPAESGSWLVYFGEQEVGQVLEKCVCITNNGTSCLKYSWEIVFPSWTDSELPLVQVKFLNKAFFFDKNDGSVLPGHEKSIKLQFKSDVAGVFCEKWEIQFSHSADTWESVILDLQAVAINKSSENLKAIESYIESCTSYSIAKKSVEEILKRNRPERPPELPYNWKFLEEEIFLHNNPELFYDNKLVHKLKNIHRTITKGPWDYSVASLRNRLLEKTLLGEKTVQLESLMSTVYQLMRPNYPKCSLEKDRYKTVYDLLCCFVNQMEVDSVHLQAVIGLPLRFLDLKESEVELRRTSITSAKISTKLSQFSRKVTNKRGLQKTKSSSLKKPSFSSMGSIENGSYFTTSSVSSSNENLAMKKQEYLESFFVKTYCHLSNTIDNMSAVLESYDNLRKKTVFESFKGIYD